MTSHIQISEADQSRIKEAVTRAEGRTSGEIVPYIVQRSDRYDVASYRGGILGGGLGLLVVVLFDLLYAGWGWAWLFTAEGTALLTVLAAAAGFAIAYVPPIRRLLAGRETLRAHVHGRALQAFLEEEVFKTRDRTGILLFVSLFERHIEVIGDEGINRKVEASEWIEIVDTIRRGILADKTADGLVAAIDRCGGLLEEHEVAIRADDTDELSNRLRLRPE